MSAPSVEPGQSSSEESEPSPQESEPSLQESEPSPQESGFSPQESEPGPSPSGHHGFHDLLKLAKGLAVAVGVLATLLIGIAIGNSTRKRIDRMSHGA